jgi:hypothetical protein
MSLAARAARRRAPCAVGRPQKILQNLAEVARIWMARAAKEDQLAKISLAIQNPCIYGTPQAAMGYCCKKDFGLPHLFSLGMDRIYRLIPHIDSYFAVPGRTGSVELL